MESQHIKQRSKIQKILLRYYPPGIIMEYTNEYGNEETKSIDVFGLSEKYLRTKREQTWRQWPTPLPRLSR